MYKLEFTLKQHTPIIHFQHDQDGATLRATELKPKLDKFILTGMGTGETERDRFEHGVELALRNMWLTGNGEHPSLDYKLRIHPTKTNKIIIANRMIGGRPGQNKTLADAGYDCVEFSPYFAQEKEFGELFDNNKFVEGGKTYNCFSVTSDFEAKVLKLKTLGLFTAEDITISFVCFTEDLRNEIERNLKYFFAGHNFGTRQSKGFGCFLPKGIDDETIINCLIENRQIKGVFQVFNKMNFKEKLKKISQDYTILKRGDSYGTYIKSRLWEYLCADKLINWEKKEIKQHIKANNITLFRQLKYDKKKSIHLANHHIDSCNGSKDGYFIRALLGLAEQYEFVKFDGERVKVKIEDSLKFENDESLKAKAVSRFASPIRYLISDTSIFIATTEIPDELVTYTDNDNKIKSRKFRFTIGELGAGNFLELPIPAQFDLEKFVEVKAGYGVNLK